MEDCLSGLERSDKRIDKGEADHAPSPSASGLSCLWKGRLPKRFGAQRQAHRL